MRKIWRSDIDPNQLKFQSKFCSRGHYTTKELGAHFCENCGDELKLRQDTSDKYCPYCWKEKETTNFCKFCGFGKDEPELPEYLEEFFRRQRDETREELRRFVERQTKTEPQAKGFLSKLFGL